MPLRFADFVDLELQLKQDAETPRAELVQRDGDIRNKLGTPPTERAELLEAWLSACRDVDAQGLLVGRAFERGYRAAGVLLFFVALGVGWGTGAGLFRFTGEHPINVLTVLGVLVAAQVAIVTLTLLSLVVLRVSPKAYEALPFYGLVRGAVRSISSGMAKLGRTSDDRAAQFRRVSAYIAQRRSLYGGVERALVFRAIQLAAVAFNVGVVGCFLVLISVSDLAFGWSTTLELAAGQLHAACATLATPWAWAWPAAVPSAELIEATQYSRFDNAYRAASGSGVSSGGWWAFLMMSVVTYGLLPRLVLSLFAGRAVRRALARAPLDTPEIDRVVQRLVARRLVRRRDDDPADTRPLGEGAEPVRPPVREEPGAEALCVKWRDAVFEGAALDAILADAFSATRRGPMGAAGGYDYAEDEAFLERVDGEDGSSPVFIVVEPWASPDRAFKRFLKQLRSRGGAARHLNVLLTSGGSGTHTQMWAGYLAEVADPYLALDTEVAVPASTSTSTAKPTSASDATSAEGGA